METQLACPSCNQTLAIDDAWAGQQVNCPVCHAPFIIPVANPVPVAATIPLSPPTLATNHVPHDENQAPQERSIILQLGCYFFVGLAVLVGIASLLPKEDDAPPESLSAPIKQKAPSRPSMDKVSVSSNSDTTNYYTKASPTQAAFLGAWMDEPESLGILGNATYWTYGFVRFLPNGSCEQWIRTRQANIGAVATDIADIPLRDPKKDTDSKLKDTDSKLKVGTWTIEGQRAIASFTLWAPGSDKHLAKLGTAIFQLNNDGTLTVSDGMSKKGPSILRKFEPDLPLNKGIGVGESREKVSEKSEQTVKDHHEDAATSDKKVQPAVPKLTKAEWRTKLMSHQSAAAGLTRINGRLNGWDASEFKALMGEPDSTAKVDDEAFWYYKCSDGTIELVLRARYLQANLMEGNINDF